MYLNEPRNDHDGKLVNVSAFYGCHGDSSLFQKQNMVNMLTFYKLTFSDTLKFQIFPIFSLLLLYVCFRTDAGKILFYVSVLNVIISSYLL